MLGDIRGRDDGISPERFDDLWRLFRAATRRIVTQHVVAETYGLRNRLSSLRHQKELVWDGAMRLLADPGVEEEPCLVRDLSADTAYRQILIEIGPADAGLIYTAEHHRATIVTDDNELAHWAGLRSVPVALLPQIG